LRPLPLADRIADTKSLPVMRCHGRGAKEFDCRLECALLDAEGAQVADSRLE